MSPLNSRRVYMGIGIQVTYRFDCKGSRDKTKQLIALGGLSVFD